MKKILFLFLMVVIGSCSKDDDTSGKGDPSPSITKLTITVVDESGKAVPNASVKLFLTQDNWINDVNDSNHGVTGNDGVIIFNDVLNQGYYMSVNSQCLSNNIGNNIKTSTLAIGVNNVVTVRLQLVSSLILKNKSTNPYSVEITGLSKMIMNGGTTLYLTRKVPFGNVKIKALQLSGYILYPTERNFNEYLICDGTKTIEFP